MNPYKRQRRDSGPTALSPSATSPTSQPVAPRSGAAATSTTSPRSYSPLSDVDEQRRNKKARLSVPRLSSPAAASRGVGMDEDDDEQTAADEGLELLRKEAIYRQMLMYKRLHAQSAQRCHKLESEKKVLDGQARSVEVCWTQLVNAVQGVAGDPGAGDPASPRPTSLTPTIHNLIESDASDLISALQDRLSATQLLIKRVVELATPSHSYHPDSANLQERCIRTEADNAALQATVSTLRSDKQSLVEELESSKESLIAAQRKTDRLRMELDKSKRERGGSMTKSDEHTHGNGVITKGQEALKSESSGVAKMEVDSRPGTPNGHVNDVNPATAAGATVRAFNAGTHEQEGDVAWLRECLAAKQKEIDELRGRLKEYAEEMDFLRTCAYSPQDEVVLNSTVAKTLHAQLEEYMSKLGEANARYEEVNAKVDEMRDNAEGFREAVIHEARTEIDALRSQMRSKEADVLRLRQQRDVLQNDLDAKRSALAQRFDHANAMQALAEKREERLQVLSSEVKRIRSKLAANMGKEEMLEYLLDGAQASYVDSLEEQLKLAKQREAALQSQVNAYAEQSADVAACMETESRLRQDLAELKDRIRQFEKVSSTDSSLHAQLEEKEKERKVLELRVKEGEAAQHALYGEVEGLTKAWEGLDQQLKSKVFELRDHETKVVKAEVEKSKAFNKYYDVCREKEGLAADKAATERTIKLQRTALDKAREVENGLHAQLSDQEKALTQLKNTLISHQTHIEHLNTQTIGLKAEVENQAVRTEAALTVSKQRIAERDDAVAAQKRAEDDVRELRWKLKEAESKQSTSSGKVANGREYAELQKERDMLFGILRCSACDLRFKEKIIQKCLHTFCKECIESRMESRSRKCPTCMIPISHSDIKPLF